MTQTRTELRVIEIAGDDPWLFEAFGVGDLAGVEGANARTVELSERSTLQCPMHGRCQKPDACRSCAFLAGETGRT
jgi:hypothetical protein